MKLLLIFLCLWTVGTMGGTQLDKSSEGAIPARSVLEYLIRLHSTVSRLDETVSSLKSENQKLKFRTNMLKNKTEELENWTKNKGRGKVASFQVQQKGGHLTLGNNEVIKFDDVTLNTGNAYNHKSGIFITPVTGTYFFWANIMSTSPNHYAIILKREGQELCRGYPGLQLSHGTATITHLVKLTKGDRVWFANEQGGTKTVAHGYRYSSYGGTLMYVYR